MQRYANRGGDSGVAAYEIGDSWLRVMFTSGAIYRYTCESAGEQNIETMKALAIDGHGLNGFINRCVKYSYAHRER